MKRDFAHLLASLPQAPQPRYPHGTPFVPALAHGSMTLELFAPASAQLGADIQQPHAQDEIYIVQRGTSGFWLEDQRLEVGPGDALFVPAGRRHRFEDFSENFVTWVVFYGPPGGETP